MQGLLMREQWQTLPEHVSDPNPFFESWFLLSSVQALVSAGNVRLFCSFAGGRLTGLMPVHRSRDYYGNPVPHLASWVHANSFCGLPLIASGHEHYFWQDLLDWADREAGAGLFLHLSSIPADAACLDALRNIIGDQGRKAVLVQSHERAMLQSAETAQAYFNASLSSKKRKELRRQQKRLSEEGNLCFLRQTGMEDLGQWIESFLALEHMGWKGAHGSALACDPATQQMFCESVAGAAQAGRLERLSIRLDGRPIAMLANFVTPPGLFSFKTAYDETYARFSPGVLLQQENLALLERSDIHWADSCAAADHPMIERIWREKRRIISVNIAIGGTLRRVLFGQIARMETGGKQEGL